MTYYDSIFRKALASKNPDAIIKVAQAFETMSMPRKANILYERANTLYSFAFGSGYESHSVDDLVDIVTAKDATMINLANMVKEIYTKPEFVSSGTKDAYYALSSRYRQARDNAQKTIDKARSILHIKPLGLTDATKEYGAFLDVLNSHWRENKWTPGDWSIDDVSSRLQALGASGQDSIPIPQPRAIHDLNIANEAAHAVDYARHNLAKGAQDATGYIATTVAKAAKDASKELGISSTELVLIGVGVLVGLFMLNRLMIPVKI